MPDFYVKPDSKAKIRAKVLAGRRSLSAPALADAATAVRRVALELARRHGQQVAAYVPIGTEPGGPDLAAALAEVLAPGRLLLPVLCPDLDLDWAVFSATEPLEMAGMGLREPAGPRLGRTAIAGSSLVIVPALAVDRRGRRLGRGGGSYDRALARLPVSTLTVALLHDGELLDSLPAEPHDQRVRAVITPTAGLVPLDEQGSDGALLALG